MESKSDPIRRHEILLPINHNYNKFCDILGFFKSKLNLKFGDFFVGSEKKPFKCARAMARTVQLLRLGMYCVLLHCPISAEIRTVVGLSDLRNF